jgi:hypothetical protein
MAAIREVTATRPMTSPTMAAADKSEVEDAGPGAIPEDDDVAVLREGSTVEALDHDEEDDVYEDNDGDDEEDEGKDEDEEKEGDEDGEGEDEGEGEEEEEEGEAEDEGCADEEGSRPNMTPL